MGSGGSAPIHDDVHVVIVGGGYGGITLALKLRSICKYTLIDPKDCFFHNIGALRACVERNFADKIFVPYSSTFADSFVRGKVVNINKAGNSITLEDGKVISYTHLVLCTGTGSPFPGKVTSDHPNLSKSDGIELYTAINNEIVESETIICVGGGAVGVELSGEIKQDFPNKNVILLHSRDFLCSKRLKRNTQVNLQKCVLQKGINLMLNERASNLSELQMNKCVKGQVLKTESGKEIKVDLILPCTGVKFATEVFRSALGDSMTEHGQLKVDDFLLVEGTENIYAIGDITNIDEEKMAYLAMCHAELIAENLVHKQQKKDPKRYKTPQFLMIVPVGRNGGVGELFGHTVGNFVSKMFKAKSMFVARYWSLMEQKMPK